MKKLTKRILSVFLIALLVCTLLPMGAFAEEVAEPQTEKVSEQKVVVVDAVAERGLVSGEKQTCRFKILYVDSSYNLGYNYGDDWNVDYTCQYTTGHSGYNHSMNCSVIKEQVDAASGMVSDGWEIVGWAKKDGANPTVFTTYTGTTATQTSYTIWLVAKKTTPPVVNTTFTVNYMDGTIKVDTDTKTSAESSASFTVISTVPTKEGYTAGYNLKCNRRKIRRQYAGQSVKWSHHNNINTEARVLSYTHFTLEERKYLQKLLSEGYSQRKIAAILERSPSTISREIQRNRAKWKPHQKPDNPYWYNHWRAQNLYIRRRREQQRMALRPGTEAWDFIVAGLNRYWSPETIAGRWHLEYPERKPLCISTIYRYVKKRLFPKITPKTHLRRRGKRILPRNSNYNSIQPERIIPQWPEEIRQRARIGDWEGDTVYGGVGKGLLVTQVDRKSRFLRAGLLAKRDASLTKAVICQLLKDVPVKSISLDNGSEFSEFKALESELHTLVYFAEPHKPWQRGTNENTNGLLRFFFPKGCDFHAVSQKFVDSVVDLINSRPRKCLGWRSPAEVFHNLGVALA